MDVRCLNWSFRSYHAPEFSPTGDTEIERTSALLDLVPNPKRPYPHIHPLTKLVSTTLNVPISTVDFIYENETYIAASSRIPDDGTVTKIDPVPPSCSRT